MTEKFENGINEKKQGFIPCFFCVHPTLFWYFLLLSRQTIFFFLCGRNFFFLCGQKEETRKNREHAPPSNKWAFRCLAAELASPLRQSSPETTPKSLICYRRLPLSFALLTPRHLSGQMCEGVLITELSHPYIILNHSISLLVCAHDSPPICKGRGWGWGGISLIISDITLRCNTPPPTPPLKWEGNCMARHP